MDQTFIKTLDIRDIFQQKVTEKRIDIYFTINKTPLRMVLSLNEEKAFSPYTIIHNEEGAKRCSICGINVSDDTFYTKCLSLLNHYNEIFQRLIEHPSIRLEWLYIPHVEV